MATPTQAPAPARTVPWTRRFPWTRRGFGIALLLVLGFAVVDSLLLLRERRMITGIHLDRIGNYLRAHWLPAGSAPLPALHPRDCAPEFQWEGRALGSGSARRIALEDAQYLGRGEAGSALAPTPIHRYDVLVRIEQPDRTLLFARAAVHIQSDPPHAILLFRGYAARSRAAEGPAPDPVKLSGRRL
jgi:hypothetical protein